MVITAGTIRYHIDFIANPQYRGGVYSPSLTAKIRRRNVPEYRTVYFDGAHSRREEINVDYCVQSPCFELRTAANNTVTYCKAFSDIRFCYDYPEIPAANGPPPDLRFTSESARIAGYPCLKAEYQGRRHLYVWYTDAIDICDPTGAVLKLEGVPGFILQTEDLSDGGSADILERIRVVDLKTESPPPELFQIPDGYRRFRNVDEARAEQRRKLAQSAAEQTQNRPLTQDEQDMYLGRWLHATPEDKIEINITRSSGNTLCFQTTVLTAAPNTPDCHRNEKAVQFGRRLLVEDPPNYRLYQLNDSHQVLTEIGNDLFAYHRQL